MFQVMSMCIQFEIPTLKGPKVEKENKRYARENCQNK